MAKQPYIPLYTGDYLKDTRMLPLSVRGAWVDLMIFMWDSKDRGVLVATLPEYAMLLSCSFEDANFAIGLLQQKGICDFEILPNGLVKLICRRMVRDVKLSKTRSEAGKAGAEAKLAKDFAKAKTQANTDIIYDNGIRINVPRDSKFSPDDFYTSGQQAFEDVQADETLVERLQRVVKGEGVKYCDAVLVMKGVRRFITTEEAKPNFLNRPRDDLKTHLVNWIRTNAKQLNQYG